MPSQKRTIRKEQFSRENAGWGFVGAAGPVRVRVRVRVRGNFKWGGSEISFEVYVGENGCFGEGSTPAESPGIRRSGGIIIFEK